MPRIAKRAVTNVKARVREMQGADILTYTIGDPKDSTMRTK